MIIVNGNPVIKPEDQKTIKDHLEESEYKFYQFDGLPNCNENTYFTESNADKWFKKLGLTKINTNNNVLPGIKNI